MFNLYCKDETLNKFKNAVSEIEKTTSCELMIVISRFSGNYKDKDACFGVLGIFLILFIILFSNFNFSNYFVIPDCALAFALFYFMSSKIPVIRRILTTPKRRLKEAEEGSKTAFFDEKITHTRDRNGILIYVALFEKKVIIHVDTAIEAKIQPALWNHLSNELENILFITGNNIIDSFTKTLIEKTQLLKDSFPRKEDDVNEISDMPRLR